MPAIPKNEAVERLAKSVESAAADDLIEIYSELFPADALPVGAPRAHELAHHVRTALEPEEIVDLWNVVFPADRNVYYEEEDDTLHYNEREARYATP